MLHAGAPAPSRQIIRVSTNSKFASSSNSHFPPIRVPPPILSILARQFLRGHTCAIPTYLVHMGPARQTVLSFFELSTVPGNANRREPWKVRRRKELFVPNPNPILFWRAHPICNSVHYAWGTVPAQNTIRASLHLQFVFPSDSILARARVSPFAIPVHHAWRTSSSSTNHNSRFPPFAIRRVPLRFYPGAPVPARIQFIEFEIFLSSNLQLEKTVRFPSNSNSMQTHQHAKENLQALARRRRDENEENTRDTHPGGARRPAEEGVGGPTRRPQT